ncbi:hypothetical protein [Sphingomonas alpina]|uniref:Uncharacterized protein n=1 Tax=Sphingomonas alpina TaxID=653931 RepID=A0A7H0LEF7_9SPHN|nr:hypothetical protein [Sphingomonas alpina]QNQ08060.1 hypothetical protein H3Z74_14880 [Sphingomonas alpina]
MKSVVLGAVLALAAAAPVAAQTAPAAAPTTPAAPAAAAAATKFNLDTPIETIAADPAGKAVLDTDLPGVTTHAMYDSFKGMSLNQLQPMSGGAIPPEALVKVGADLAAIK